MALSKEEKIEIKQKILMAILDGDLDKREVFELIVSLLEKYFDIYD
jgi:hypothetical protein